MLNESLTKYMAYSLFILAILNLFDLVVLQPTFLMGFSVAALIFVLNDFMEYKANEKNDPFKYGILRRILFFIAAIAFMVVPVVPIPWSVKALTKINDFSVLLSVGIVFYVMNLKNEKVASDKLKQIMDEITLRAVEDFKKDELPKIIDTATKELIDDGSIKEMINQAVIDIENERKVKSQ